MFTCPRPAALTRVALATGLILTLWPAALSAQDAGGDGDQPVPAWWETIDLRGDIAIEGRVFPYPPLYDDDKQEQGSGVALLIAPEFSWESDDRNTQVVFSPYARLDSVDNEASYADIRELYFARYYGQTDVLIGVNTVFWGVAESNHLVDIINQTAPVEDLDGEDKLGQPMISVGHGIDWGDYGSGALRGWLLPVFRQPVFPGKEGRFRGPVVVDTERPVYDRDAAEAVVDFAARYSHVYESFDLGVTAFRGYDRDPRLEPEVTIGGDPADPDIDVRVRPHYDTITQLGFDGQFTQDALLLKAEAFARWGQGDPYQAAVGGFEYTFYGVDGDGLDVGLLAEYSWDGRDTEDAPGTLFDNDLFVGSRITFNDVEDTEILAGTIVDLDDGSTLWSLEASRRVLEDYRLEVEARILASSGDDSDFDLLRNDDVIIVRVARFF